MAAATTWGWWRWNVELTKNIWLNLDISYNFPQQGQFSNQVIAELMSFRYLVYIYSASAKLNYNQIMACEM